MLRGKMNNCKYLINEDPIFFLPTLAVGIGLNEAIILQKIHGWLQCTPKEHVGRNWIYNSYKSWKEQLPFLSESTIKRAVKNLIDKGIIITENFNKKSFDKTLWYSINYEKLSEIVEISDSVKMTYGECQNDTRIVSKWTDNTNNNYNNIYNNNTTTDTIFDFLEKNGFVLTPIHYEIIQQWEDTELTRYAVKQAVLNNKFNINYIDKIIYSYKKNNIQTVQQAIEREEEFNNKRELYYKKKYEVKESRYEREKRILEEMCRDEEE